MRNRQHGIDFLFVGHSKQAFEGDIALLRKAGFKTIEFTDNAVSARNILLSTRVSFIISELDMPHMNGIEFLKLVRRHPFLMATPFLLVSKDKQMEMIKYALDEAADGYLLFPYSGEELLCSIIRIKIKLSSLSEQQVLLRNTKRQLLKREYDTSIKNLQELLKVDPENIEALLIIGECYFRKQEVEPARTAIKKILKKQPNHCKALHLLSKLCQIESDCGDAFNFLTAAQHKNPLNVDLLIDLGKFYLETSLDEKANTIFQQILTQNPTDLNLIKIGKALLKKERLDDAANFLNKTVNPLPETTYIFNHYADLLYKSGKIEESIDQLKKCIDISPGVPEHTIKYAEALKGLGRTAEANEALRSYLKIDPEDAKIKSILQSL